MLNESFFTDLDVSCFWRSSNQRGNLLIEKLDTTLQGLLQNVIKSSFLWAIYLFKFFEIQNRFDKKCF